MADIQLDTLGNVIKQAYEGEPNTNAYTDDDKTQVQTNETDITSLEGSKEDDLGNPSISGQVLSSTTAGARTWITTSSDITELSMSGDVTGDTDSNTVATVGGVSAATIATVCG